MQIKNLRTEPIFREYSGKDIESIANEWGEEPDELKDFQKNIQNMGYSLDGSTEKQLLPAHTEDVSKIVTQDGYAPLRNLIINFYAMPDGERVPDKYWMQILPKAGYESRLSNVEKRWQHDYNGKVIDQRFSKTGLEAYRAGQSMPEGGVIDFDLVFLVLSEELKRKKERYKSL